MLGDCVKIISEEAGPVKNSEKKKALGNHFKFYFKFSELYIKLYQYYYYYYDEIYCFGGKYRLYRLILKVRAHFAFLKRNNLVKLQ